MHLIAFVRSLASPATAGNFPFQATQSAQSNAPFGCAQFETKYNILFINYFTRTCLLKTQTHTCLYSCKRVCDSWTSCIMSSNTSKMQGYCIPSLGARRERETETGTDRQTDKDKDRDRQREMPKSACIHRLACVM